MSQIKLPILVLLSLALVGVTYGQQLSHDERCQVLEGNGVRVDQCDGTKLLSCRDGRCQCADPANQIFTFRHEVISTRGKRSPKKGGGGSFKKVAAGAVAGAATYHIASQAGKSISRGFTTTPPPPKYKKVYSCYSRVGGQCALNYNNVESVDSTTSTTTAAPAAAVTPEATTAAAVTNVTAAASDNSTDSSTTTTTTIAPAPVAAALTTLDISKIPKCVQYAVCKHASPSSGNSTSGFLQKVDFDPRVGTCECESGYKANSKDLCEKVSGAGKTAGTSMAVILAALIVNKMFV